MKKKGCLPIKTLGKRIAVCFHDHSIYSTEQVQCEIMGIVEKVNDKEVIVRWWQTSEEVDDSNNEVARVLQGTIIKWALCEPRKWNEVE